MSSSEREFEVVVWGATGFTGRLVVEHLSQHFSYSSPSLRWALGGRDRTKLERVAGELNSPAELPPILVGDSFDRPRLDEIARRTSVICSTVGPYARYGSALVAACVEHGTHYCDLSGEIQWMREMIDRHEAQAQSDRRGSCIVVDSILSHPIWAAISCSSMSGPNTMSFVDRSRCEFARCEVLSVAERLPVC